MSYTSEIKKNLITRIQKIDDLIFLEAIKSMLDASEIKSYELNEDQEKSILLSRNEIKSGKFKESKTAISELREWLNKE